MQFRLIYLLLFLFIRCQSKETADFKQIINTINQDVCPNENGGKMIIEGIYKGKNVYVQSPMTPTGNGFCVISIEVNDNPTTESINSSAFEIDLVGRKYELGDKIRIEMEYKSCCTPKILNPEVIDGIIR